MNKTTLTATAAVAGVALVAYNLIHYRIIVKRFPNLDPKVVRKAYKTMMTRALSGAYADTDDSDETMDKIFMDIVLEQNPTKY